MFKRSRTELPRKPLRWAQYSEENAVGDRVFEPSHQESTLKTEYEVKPNKQVKDTESDSVTDLKLKGDACESKYHTTHRMAQDMVTHGTHI